MLAAGATAIGFFSFVPTDYVGVRELGWIAGAGMIIAIALNFTLLPALLTLLQPRAEPEPVGFRWAAPLDRCWSRHRRIACFAGAGGGAWPASALLPRVTFDFNPLNLKDPNSESVSTAFDLMKDPDTSPYSAQILAPSLKAAGEIGGAAGANCPRCRARSPWRPTSPTTSRPSSTRSAICRCCSARR